MQLSKQDIDKHTDKEIMDLFYQVTADLSGRMEAESLFTNVLTDVELKTIAKRIAIAYYLDQGKSYEKIRDQLKVSSATIASVQSKIGTNDGISLALRKVKAEKWASKWAKKVVSLFD